MLGYGPKIFFSLSEAKAAGFLPYEKAPWGWLVRGQVDATHMGLARVVIKQ